MYIPVLARSNSSLTSLSNRSVTPGHIELNAVLTKTRDGIDVFIVQELCESRGGRPELSVLTNLLVSVDVKNYRTMLRYWSQLVPNMSTDIRGH